MEAERQGLTTFRGSVGQYGVVQRSGPLAVRRFDRFGEIQDFFEMPQLTALNADTATRASRAQQAEMKPVRAVLFDLDERWCRPERLVAVVCENQRSFGLASTPRSIFSVAEDNMFHGLRKHCRDHARADEAASHFLDLLQREYNPEFVPGMTMSSRLCRNCSLAVISSNSWQQFGASERRISCIVFRTCSGRCGTGQAGQREALSFRQVVFGQPGLHAGVSRSDEPPISNGDQIVLVTDTSAT